MNHPLFLEFKNKKANTKCVRSRRHPDLNWGLRCCRPLPYHLAMTPDDPWENRTPVTAVKGRCLDRLTNGPYVSDQRRYIFYH